MNFIDFHWYMHICQTTLPRCRWLGGMTSCDAAECFAEARGHLGARPDRMWGPAQASTSSKRVSEIWNFHDFHDLVRTPYTIHTYTVTSKNLRTMCYLSLTFRKCAQGARIRDNRLKILICILWESLRTTVQNHWISTFSDTESIVGGLPSSRLFRLVHLK